MRMSGAVWAWTLLGLVALVTARTASGRKRNNQDCGDWTYGECVAKKGTCGPGRKPGTRTGDTCHVKERHFRCVVACTEDSGPRDLPGRTRGRDGRRKNKPVPCRYERAPWGDCDATSGERTRTLTLKKGDETCDRTKTETKKCKAAAGALCKYQRGEWGGCDAKTNTRTRTLTLKRGDATTCEASKPETKPCKGTGVGGKAGKCRYQRGEWSACDPTTNTRTRTNTLKRANVQCEATQVETKKCKKACRYVKAEWGACNEAGMQQRLDTLKPGIPADAACEPTRTVDRRCRNKESKPQCKYDFGTWSACTAGKRTRTKSLVSGEQVCDKTRLVVKSCKSNGQKAGRCEFGAWGAFGDCVNGVRTKSRSVTRGGEECQRRAVRTKPCRA